MSSDKDMGGIATNKQIKRAPDGFDDEDDDVGDIEENLNRGRPGPQTTSYSQNER